ncbi:hypothetical protein V6M83_00030, partial [Streptococcus anginosus]|uniref:hypothetical protein n=1 Tax=Streptococcus anginosus TaxID=1328 RepID=UPI002FF2A14A
KKMSGIIKTILILTIALIVNYVGVKAILNTIRPITRAEKIKGCYLPPPATATDKRNRQILVQPANPLPILEQIKCVQQASKVDYNIPNIF